MINKVFVGIDVGVNGAIGVVDSGGKLVSTFDMPTEVRGNKNQVNPNELVRELGRFVMDCEVEAIAIEEVHSMPGQGVASSFSFGMSYGIARGVCAQLGCRVILVRPQVWKKYHSLLRRKKDESRTRAIELLGGDVKDLRKKRDVDRAEALLIALYARSIV